MGLLLLLCLGIFTLKAWQERALGRGAVSAPDGAVAFSLVDLNGNLVRLQDHPDQVVVLNFWATWCSVCVREIPVLNQLYAHYAGKPVWVVGISTDSSIETVRNFKGVRSLSYEVLMATSEVTAQFGGIPAIPTTIILDRRHRVVHRLVGVRSLDELIAKIDPLI